MNERERAEQLARAIDELIHGTPRPRPTHFDDHELQSLVQVAQARLSAGKSVASAGADHEAAVWEQLIARLEGRPRPARPKAGDDIDADDEMRQTIAARREMSDSILALANQHKDDVWRRVQERITKRRGYRGKPPSPSGGASGDAGLPPMRTRYFPTGNPDIDSLLAVAANRPALRATSAQAMNTQQRRLHDRMRNDPARRWRDLALSQADSQAGWGRLAVFGVALVLIIAALGPIPGLSRPAAVEAARYVGRHLGVMETDSLPPASTPSTIVLPEDVTQQQASERLGLPVSAPETVLGLPQTSSRFFAAGLTSDGRGLFVLTYQAADGTSAVTIYQEATGHASLAVPPGEAADTTVNGEPATYYEGAWSEAGGAVTWQKTGTQTLVFEGDGLRTTVQYTGAEIDMAGLTAAVAMLPPPAS
jgi:hypothetical protein